MAYIYKITNIINNKCYIGKTLNTVQERWREHCSDYKKRDEEKRPLYSAMKKYGIENFKVEEVEQCSENIVNEREKYWIEYYGSFHNGYNATLGGDGKAYLDRQLLIKTYNEIQNIKETAKILNIDAGHLSKILKENNIEVKTSQQVINEKYGRALLMLDKNSEKGIQSFISLADAARFIKNQTNSLADIRGMTVHIRQAAQGKRKTAYGYKWKFI